jgi:hypothetical protein
VVGGVWDEQEEGVRTPNDTDELTPEEKDDYLTWNPVRLCGWCRLETEAAPRQREELDTMLERARARSVSWRWFDRARGAPRGLDRGSTSPDPG